MKTYVGIDNGFTGAIAFVYPDNTADIRNLPLLEFDRRKLFDDLKLRELLTAAKNKNPAGLHIVFEMGQTQPKWAALTNYAQGLYMGTIATLVRQNGFEATGVNPKDWQKDIHQSVRARGDDTKDASIAFCRINFPHVSLFPSARAKQPNDNWADALCMAAYGRRNNL